MKQVPFVANHPDNNHCVNAVFRMIHQYYFHQDLSWDEIDKLTKAVPGKQTWTFIGEMELAKKGLEVVNIEPVDYQRLWEKGLSYLAKSVGHQKADYYLQNSNLEAVLPDIPEYLAVVKHETRPALFSEIAKFLRDGWLIGTEVNGFLLNHLTGYGFHFILIYDFDGQNFFVHDPGLPPLQARQIPCADFADCFHRSQVNALTLFRQKIS